MGNSRNKKVPKKRKASDKSKCKCSSDQKENVPKNGKRAIKPDPDDGIAMSKQLLLKKKNDRMQRKSSSSKPERICPNGKPIPSLAELEKMYEDSDDDDQVPKPPTKRQFTTKTPEKCTPPSKKNLLSPSTIHKISERLMGSIQNQNLPDPSELLEATSLLREKSPPPPPIFPPKKRKKPEVPYIVGCKERPKVVRKPNTNFCKGDDDYGVDKSSVDPEDEIPKKRAKKSNIPNYTKSIFNAHSDEIAERLTKEDAGGLSDASSDSNKTIEYDPTPLQNLRPRSFSPLPSTSTDKETIEKNDELFNESLKENNIAHELSPEKENDNEPNTNKTKPKEKEDYTPSTNELTPKKKDDSNITKQLSTPEIEEDDFLFVNETRAKRKDDVIITQQFKQNEDEVQIIDITYDTIVIEDVCDRTVELKDDNIVNKIPNDEDCMIVSRSESNSNHNSAKLDDYIVIDDEYSTINMEFEAIGNEPIEIIDVDDVIAENKTILDKWKNNAAQDLNNINTVVDVPTTYRNESSLQNSVTPSTTLQTNVTPSTTIQPTVSPSTTLQTNVTPSTTIQPTVTPSTTLQTNVTPSTTIQLTVTPNTTLQTNVTPSTTIQLTVTPNTTLQTNVTPNTTLLPTVTPSTTLLPTVTPSTTLLPTVTPSTTLQTNVTPSTALQPTVTPSTTLQTNVTPRTTLQTNVTPRTTLQTRVGGFTFTPYSNREITVPPYSTRQINVPPYSTQEITRQTSVTSNSTRQTNSTPRPSNCLNVTNRNSTSNSINNQRQTLVRDTDRTATFQSILDDFFNGSNPSIAGLDVGISGLVSTIVNRLHTPRRARNNRPPPVSRNSSSYSETQETRTTVPQSSPGPSRNIGDCPICLDPLNTSNGIASTICGHVFCLQCIQASIRTNGKKCPTCRKGLKTAGGYHQLYL